MTLNSDRTQRGGVIFAVLALWHDDLHLRATITPLL